MNINVGQDTGDHHYITGSHVQVYRRGGQKLDMRAPLSHLKGTQAFVKDYEAIMAQTRYRNSSHGIIAIGLTLLIFGAILTCF